MQKVTNFFGTQSASELKLELRSLGNDIIVLHRDGNVPSLDGRLIVYSVLGAAAFEPNLRKVHQSTLDLGSQPAGQYLIRVESRGETVVKSILLRR